MPRGWKDWVRGLAIWGVGPDEELRLIRTNEEGYLQVVQVPHAVTHQDGGSDEINVQGLSGVLADLQRGKFSFVGNYADFPAPGEPDRLAFAVDRLTIYRDTGTEWQKVATAHWDYIEGQPSEYFPAPHAATHEEGGADALTPDNIGANWDKLVNKPSTFPPSAHASSHRPGGSDALPTAAPAPITEGAAGAEGSSTALARADHVHETPNEWTPKEHGNEKHNPDFLAVDGSNAMSAKAKLLYGADLGLTTEVDRRTDNLYIARWNDIKNIIMLDYQDEFALLCCVPGRSASVSPLLDAGDVCSLFEDNFKFIRWNSETSCPDGIVITIDCSGNPIPHRYAGIYRLALTFRREAESYPTHIKVEDWDNDTSAWVTVIDQDITVVDHVVLLPQFKAQSSDARIHKLRITLTCPSPLPAILRIQRVMLYHCTCPWDPWHLHKAGGGMYGDIDMNGNDIVNPGLVDGVDVSSHAARHQNGGADEINVDGLSGQLADYQKTTWSLVADKPSSFNPSAHGSRHEVGGSDEVRPGKYGSYIVWSANNTAPTSYTLCDTGVGTRALVFLRITNTSGGTRVVYFRPGDDTWALNTNTDANIGLSPIWLANGTRSWSIMLTDSQGRISFKCDAAVTGVGITRMAYIKLS